MMIRMTVKVITVRTAEMITRIISMVRRRIMIISKIMRIERILYVGTGTYLLVPLPGFSFDEHVISVYKRDVKRKG